MKRGILFLIALIILSSCTIQPKANCSLDLENCPGGSQVGRVLPDCNFASCPPLAKMQPVSEVPVAQVVKESVLAKVNVKEFYIEADDRSLDPPSVNVNKGDLVRITFEVSEDNDYDGLEFRSEKFSTGAVYAGESKTVEFVADKGFVFSAYLPSTSYAKVSGAVNII